MSLLALRPPILACRVHGTPAPQGSKRTLIHRHTGRAVTMESSKKVAPWREAVKAAALAAHRDAERGGEPDAAVDVSLVFLLSRPKGHFRTGRNAHLLRDGAPKRPTSKPDLDKLIRSTLDALKDAGTYRDDSQVVRIQAAKEYTREPPGAVIHVWRSDDRGVR